MNRTTHMIAQCRHLLAGDAARRALLGLAVIVLAVQFGLVQHSIEHGAPLPADAGCEVCVAGAHHVPVVPGVAVVPEIQAFAEDGLPPATGYAARIALRANRARAPPVIS